MKLDGFGIMRAPSTLLFGSNERFAVGIAAARIGKKALICTDERFSKTRDMQDIASVLDYAQVAIEVFAETEAELPIEGIHKCASRYADFAPDVIIGVGGGSCIDLAKLVSLLLTHGGALSDYYGELKVPGPTIPVIAIPTTAGTGSEVTPVAVLGDSARELKVGISSPYLIPSVAICDPDLTMTCPPGLTAVAGADAMTHALEAFTALRHERKSDIGFNQVFVGKNDLSDYHALTAIKAINASLSRAVTNGADQEARRLMMFGSVVAGLAFGVAGTAAAHAIQYPVGALTKTAHGLGVATLMPSVMRYNRPVCEDEFAQIARAMGATEKETPALADEAIHLVENLFADIGIPKSLAELGLERDRIDWIAEKSMLSARLVNNNPRPLSVEAIREIVSSAYNAN